MFCIKCGEENKDTAIYCRKCGEPTGVEVETQVAVRTAENDLPRPNSEADPDQIADEVQIFSINPTLMFVKIGYVLTAIAALFLVAIASAFAYLIVPIWLAVILGLLIFIVPAYYHIEKKLVRYTLTETKLEIDEGLIARTTKSMPLRRIQDVTVSATATQRLLGIGDLEIDNASDDGLKVVLKNINSPKDRADDLLNQMRRIEGQNHLR